MLICDDVPVGHYVDDGVINMLLGSGTTAAHMRQMPFDMRLNAPLICTSNAPPQITSTNVRRLKPIQCGAAVPIHEQDPGIRAAMSTNVEVSACLRWLLDGCRAWRVHGIRVPATCVERATEAAAASPVAEFTHTFQPGERVESGAVFARWREFKNQHGEHAGSHRAMVGELRAAGWSDARTKQARYLIAPRVTLGDASAIYLYTRNARATLQVNRASVIKRHPAANPPANIDDFPPGALDSPADDQVPPLPANMTENQNMTPPAPTLEELRAAATAAGAELALDGGNRPIWWFEPDGRITVAVETPAAPPGDPDPSGNACSRCGRPWAAATGPGHCSRCDGGAAWDDDDAERRLRRLPTEDLQMLDATLANQGGRDADLVIVHDELARRGAA